MDTSEEVLEAARRRAAALATGDAEELRSLLHPQFRWVSHTGQRFDRDTYVESNTDGSNRWSSQELSQVDVVAHPQTAVLRCHAVDEVDRGHGLEQLERPMTQVWVRHDDRWVLLVGHSGPALS